MLQVSLHCPFLIAPSVFSNVYFLTSTSTELNISDYYIIVYMTLTFNTVSPSCRFPSSLAKLPWYNSLMKNLQPSTTPKSENKSVCLQYMYNNKNSEYYSVI